MKYVVKGPLSDTVQVKQHMLMDAGQRANVREIPDDKTAGLGTTTLFGLVIGTN